MKSEDGRVHFRCGVCYHRLSVPLEHSGRRGRCGGCGKVIRIPGKKMKRGEPRRPEFIRFEGDAEGGQSVAGGERKPVPASAKADTAAAPEVETASKPAGESERPAGNVSGKPSLKKRPHAALVCAGCGRKIDTDDNGRLVRCPCGSLLTRRK